VQLQTPGNYIAPGDNKQGGEMVNWKSSKMISGYFDDDDDDCQVVIDGARIAVSYEDERGLVNYVGNQVGTGHWVLRAAERGGEATLHQIPNGRYLEGFWKEKEEGYQGFWRIQLGE